MCPTGSMMRCFRQALKCVVSESTFPLFTSKVNYRNHRKIVVIDGRVGFVGGMNLAERYMRGFSWGVWRDTHLLLEGKAVHGLQTAFLLDWYFVDRTLISASVSFRRWKRPVLLWCRL